MSLKEKLCIHIHGHGLEENHEKKMERGRSLACSYLHNNTMEETQEMEAEAFFFLLLKCHTTTIHKRGVCLISPILEYTVHSVNPNHTYVAMPQVPHTRVAIIQLLFGGDVSHNQPHP